MRRMCELPPTPNGRTTVLLLQHHEDACLRHSTKESTCTWVDVLAYQISVSLKGGTSWKHKIFCVAPHAAGWLRQGYLRLAMHLPKLSRWSARPRPMFTEST